MPKRTFAEAGEEFNNALKTFFLTVCKELRINKLLDWLNTKLSKSLK